ncbi:hypothetical protein E3W66_09535 [Gammaproteobacteria bacterium LSUCC0057]|uniref:Histidine kinase VP0354-like sensor domain-containing protein n=1 Tax=Gammaproteobacteria bacterium LSUCC0057 TaxID=2559237 RepID=A0A4Y8UGJ4_9GAMM|nr:hypothetical protein E3W66_09535 [Gammaproteobacteria bacterium LSUCC0057]
MSGSRGFLSGSKTLYLAALGLLLVVFFIVALQRYQERLLQLVLNSQQAELVEASEQLIADLQARSDDLKLLTNLPELAHLDPSRHLDRSQLLQRVGEYFLRFLQAYPEYDQVRLLDSQGREQLNVKRQDQTIRLIPRHQLQDKSARYYVAEALAQPHNAVYLSRIDLNREFGEVQRPYQPTLRMVRAIEGTPGEPAAAQATTVNGLVVANLSVTELLQRYSRALRNIWQVDIFLVDDNGYFIIHPDTAMQWGFDLNAVGHRFGRVFPKVWSQLQAGQSIVSYPAGTSPATNLQGYQRGGHFISHQFQLPGVASGAAQSSPSAHRYRGIMFVANQSLEPWSLRYHWVWWAFMLFLLLLVGLALLSAYSAYRWQRKHNHRQGELALQRQQLERWQQKVTAGALLRSELRQLLREIRNHTAAVVGFAALVKNNESEQPSQMAENLQIIERGARRSLHSVDEAQKLLADDEAAQSEQNEPVCRQ